MKPNRASLAQGFTMIEIALSLAIIAFALIAIIGVLPAGVKVQQENRENTIINQDGLLFLEAIRDGAQGMDELTNYVESIVIRSALAEGPVSTTTYTSTNAAGLVRLLNGAQIIGLLSTPSMAVAIGAAAMRTNSVTAYVKAISGNAGRKIHGRDQFAFRYRMQVEVTPFLSAAPAVSTDPVSVGQLQARENNLYDLRLTFDWPVFQMGSQWRVGANRRVFRTLVCSELSRTSQTNFLGRTPLFFFHPNSFVSTP